VLRQLSGFPARIGELLENYRFRDMDELMNTSRAWAKCLADQGLGSSKPMRPITGTVLHVALQLTAHWYTGALPARSRRLGPC
jgi:methionyl-tRNA synthetase